MFEISFIGLRMPHEPAYSGAGKYNDVRPARFQNGAQAAEIGFELLSSPPVVHRGRFKHDTPLSDLISSDPKQLRALNFEGIGDEKRE